MRRAACVFAIVLLASVAVGHAQEGGFKVIGHAATTPDEVSKKDLGRLFLKQKKSWNNGQRAVPVDQRVRSEVRSDFCQTVLGKSLREVDSYWQGLVFSGKGSPPKTVGSDQDVVAFVRSTPGAVGYVSASASLDGVKVVRING